MGKFIGDLIVRVINDDAAGLFELYAPFSFMPEVSGKIHTTNTGDRTDFCSVPMVPGVYEMLGGKYRKSGAIHDKLYSSHEVDRATADAILKEMLLTEGAPEVEAEAFYVAVREFGGSHW